MAHRIKKSGLLMALVAGLSAATTSAVLAQGEPAAPPPMGGPGGPGGPHGGPEGGPPGMDGPGMSRPGEGNGREMLSDRELAERLRGRADEVERLARSLREAAEKVEHGDGRLDAFRMIEDAARPLRGDWLERLAGRRMNGRGEGREERMGEGRREGRPGEGGPEARGPEGRGPEGRGGDARGPEGRGPEGLGGPEGRGQEGKRALTDAERESMMAFAREKLPRVAQRIDELRKTDPQLADRVMLRLAPRVREVLATRDADLAALRLEELQTGAEVLDQVRVLREAMKKQDAAATESAKGGLKTALEAQFDARIKLQQHEVTMLNSRIESLRADIEKRQAGKADFVAKLLERMSNAEPEGVPPDGPDSMGGPGRGPDGPQGRGSGEGRHGGQRGDGSRGDGPQSHGSKS